MERGFSLVEVVVALALTALSVLCLISVLIGSIRLLETSQEVSEATSVAHRLLEQIQSIRPLPVGSFDGRLGQTAVGGFPPPPYPGQSLRYDYRTCVSVSHLDDRLDSVRVDVYWNVRAHLQMATVQLR